jgi:NhaP-type Na+/H+ or K+/H+ antiporter
LNEHALLAAGLVLLFGLGSQWLAWRLRLPSILLLLLSGVFVGPVCGWLEPDVVLGELLFPFVSLSVAVILFEGGLSLKVKELRGVGRTLGLLIGVGGTVTLGLGFLAASWILGLEPRLALLLSAVFVVTGPTVIGPLLKTIRPRGAAAALAKWEGIVNDPIGASLALRVFEAFFAGSDGGATSLALGLVLKTLAIGLFFGGGVGWLLGLLFRRHAIPDYLQSPSALATVVVVFVASDHMQGESGLLAVTVMGIVLGRLESASLRHLVEFKENLRVLLLSSLFVLLAARIELADLKALDVRAFAFVAALILVVRPFSVWAATLGSSLARGERLFLAWMAPRGIVAMAVVSLFALRLEERGIPGASGLVPVTFLVVVATVLVYGLTAGPLARRLGVAAERANGVLFAGASPIVRELARVLGELGIAARLVDTNRRAVAAARLAGLDAVQANALTDDIPDLIDLSAVGSVLAVTPNDEVNALIALEFAETFGRSNVYQLPSRAEDPGEEPESSESLGGRQLFGQAIDFDTLADRYAEGATIKRTTLTETFGFDEYLAKNHERTTPLFLLQADLDLYPWAVEGTPKPRAGDTIIALVDSVEGLDKSGAPA